MHRLLVYTLLGTLLAVQINHAMESQSRLLLCYQPKRCLEIPKEQREKDAEEFIAYVKSFGKNSTKTMVATERKHVILSETKRDFLEFSSLENHSLQDRLKKKPNSVYEKVCMFSPTSLYDDTQRFWRKFHTTEKYKKLYKKRLSIIAQYKQFFNRLVQEGKISVISMKAAL